MAFFLIQYPGARESNLKSYGLKLKDLNLGKINFPGLDPGDEVIGIII